jgi:hypothetical protein
MPAAFRSTRARYCAQGTGFPEYGGEIFKFELVIRFNAGVPTTIIR